MNEQLIRKPIDKEDRMSKGKMLGTALAAAFLAAALAGCVDEQEPRSYVQSDVVDKAYFQGEWWYTNKIIDVSVETDEWGFTGESAYNLSNPEVLGVERIRWVIGENYLYAFRSYELVEGANPDMVESYIGEPVVAYAIDSHFDIRRQYNSTTGEEYNIIEENTSDRYWYEREFMRVDWSQMTMNPTVTNFNLYEAYLGGILTREQVPMYVGEGTNSVDDFPLSYRPQFDRASLEFDAIHESHWCDDPATPDVREGDFDEGELYYMSFVTQEVISPGNVTDPYTGQPVNFCMSVYSNAPYCTSNTMTIRHSFLKIGEHHDFAVTDYQNRTRQDHFGAFQTAQWIYDGGDPEDPSDPVYGEPYMYNKNAVLLRMWRDYHDADGNLLPKSERTPMEWTFLTSPETPRWLLRPAYVIFVEWNEVYAKMHRNIQGEALPTRTYDNPRDWFERPDPALNDIDCWIGDVAGEDVAAAEDPLPQKDMFLDPDAVITEEISGMDAFHDENRLHFYGSECYLSLRVNSCDAPIEAFPAEVQERIQEYMDDMGKSDIDQLSDDELFELGVQCEGRGDMRWHLLSYVDLPAPNVGWLGIATLQGDPITGELIMGDANIGAAALHGYRKRAMEEYDLITGNISELAFETGEDIREYMDNLGMTMRPSEPARDAIEADLTAYSGIDRSAMVDHFKHVYNTKGQFLKGTEGYTNIMGPERLASMRGTEYERMLLDNDESLMLAGFENLGDNPGPRPIDAILEVASPFRGGTLRGVMNRADPLIHTYIPNVTQCVMMPNSFIDYSVTKFAQDHAGMPRKNLVFEIEQKLYKDTLIHELGHILTLRHNFTGTNDPWNYPEHYYKIAAENPKPLAMDYDVDGNGALDATENQAYMNDYLDVEHQRELDGIETWMTTSMMDYTQNWYERYMPEGFLVMPYDEAAIMFAYGDQVQVYDNSAGLRAHCDDPTSGLEADCITPYNTPQVWWTYYAGGETCTTDADCPYNTAGEFGGELKDQQVTEGMVQTCGTNMHGTGACSNYYDDFDTYMASAGDSPRWVARRYTYCDDMNTPRNGGNDPRCDVFGEGASFRDNVKNLKERYLRKYLFTYFRRYRATFDYSNVMGNWSFYIWEPASIYQNLFYRYATEGEDFINDEGPYGFTDQYMAAVDLLNFWMEMITIPDIGAYEWNEVYEEYRRFSPYTDSEIARSAELIIPSGLGRHVYTSYQQGLNGIYRLEYVGTIYDKMYALEALLDRGMGFQYSNDEMWFVSFYDMFPDEVRYLLMGLIMEEPEYYAPRIVSVDPDTKVPIIQFMDFYRGNCTVESPDGITGYDMCRPPPKDTYGGMATMNDRKTFMLQNYGLIYGLAYLPTFFDAWPQEMLHFYKVGSMDDVELPAGSVEGVDYVTYTSPASHQTFLALQLEDEPGKVGGSISFELVGKMESMREDLEDWQACWDDGNPDTNCGFEDSGILQEHLNDYYGDLQAYESLLHYAIQLQQQYGINSYLGYTPSM